jgi:hypothetical protein
MSTKNLARTVIEGGRGDHSRSIRQLGHGIDRAIARQALGQAHRLVDLDEVVVPQRRSRDTSFRDKLGPVLRWLASQAGRPWDRVRSELFQRFDTRTTAGRHILHCHMLSLVEEPHLWRPRFHVDAAGILRHSIPLVRRRRTPMPLSEAELHRWLAGRLVGQRGQALFWFVLTERGGYRQDRRLNDEDERLWRSLPERCQEHHRPSAPQPRS